MKFSHLSNVPKIAGMTLAIAALFFVAAYQPAPESAENLQGRLNLSQLQTEKITKLTQPTLSEKRVDLADQTSLSPIYSQSLCLVAKDLAAIREARTQFNNALDVAQNCMSSHVDDGVTQAWKFCDVDKELFLPAEQQDQYSRVEIAMQDFTYGGEEVSLYKYQALEVGEQISSRSTLLCEAGSCSYEADGELTEFSLGACTRLAEELLTESLDRLATRPNRSSETELD